jgi:hypothetical protein
MTLDEFLDKHPEIAKSDERMQLLSVAWFMLRHENKKDFTSGELRERYNECALNHGMLESTLNDLCTADKKPVTSGNDGTGRYAYALARWMRDELNQIYRNCLPTG